METVMNLTPRTLLISTFCVASAASLAAQTPDPSGHWQGTLQIQSMSIAFEVDLARSGNGQFAGSVDIPSERLKGLPLTTVVVDGRTINFAARADQPLNGTIAEDGSSIAGDYMINGASVPFVMTRAGEANVAAPPKSAAITHALEGAWEGVLEAQGVPMHLTLAMANQGNGTSTGKIVNVDQGGLTIPVAIAQSGATVTLTFSPIAGASFTGTLNDAATELAGTYTQNERTAPLTFRRVAADAKK
jgi:hypothetical protein